MKLTRNSFMHTIYLWLSVIDYIRFTGYFRNISLCTHVLHRACIYQLASNNYLIIFKVIIFINLDRKMNSLETKREDLEYIRRGLN